MRAGSGRPTGLEKATALAFGLKWPKPLPIEGVWRSFRPPAGGCLKPNALSATSATTIGLSGMHAAQNRLDTTAHNIANSQTPGFRRQRIEQSALPQAGGVETRTLREEAPQAGELAHLAEELVAQRMSVYSFSANLKTVQTEDRMLGNMLDQTA